MKFIDTNVLLYLVSTAPDEASKAARAAEILKEGDLALSGGSGDEGAVRNFVLGRVCG